jgi:hypothetical protein
MSVTKEHNLVMMYEKDGKITPRSMAEMMPKI